MIKKNLVENFDIILTNKYTVLLRINAPGIYQNFQILGGAFIKKLLSKGGR